MSEATGALRSVVGLVGYGRMGSAFGSRLTQAGHHVVVVDPLVARQEVAIADGCRVAADIAALLALPANRILLSLPDEPAFDDVIAAAAACLTARPTEAGSKLGRVFVDTSTLGLATKERGRQVLAAAGATLLDCPVSGTGRQAQSGDLVVYASGPEDALAAALPVLEALSRGVHQVGPFGAGTKVKLLANLLVGIHNAAAAEMVALAERTGLDAVATVELVASGAGQSRMLEHRGPAMARHEYGYGATVDLFRKDLRIITTFARETGSPTPLLDVVAELYERAAELGHGSSESAAVHAVYLADAP